MRLSWYRINLNFIVLHSLSLNAHLSDSMSQKKCKKSSAAPTPTITPTPTTKPPPTTPNPTANSKGKLFLTISIHFH